MAELSTAWKIGIALTVIIIIVAIILIVGFLYNWGQPFPITVISLGVSSSGRISSSARASNLIPPNVGVQLNSNNVLQQLPAKLQYPYYDISGAKSFYMELVINIESAGILISSLIQNNRGQFILKNDCAFGVCNLRGERLNSRPVQGDRNSIILNEIHTYAMSYDELTSSFNIYLDNQIVGSIMTPVPVPPSVALGISIGLQFSDNMLGTIMPLDVISAIVYEFRFYNSSTPRPQNLQGDFEFTRGNIVFPNRVRGRNDRFTLLTPTQAANNLM